MLLFIFLLTLTSLSASNLKISNIEFQLSQDTTSWPKGFDEGGYGYRGGGYYTHGRNYHGFNPHSPIAYRRYGAWSGGNRFIAYSTRFVRTAGK